MATPRTRVVLGPMRRAPRSLGTASCPRDQWPRRPVVQPTTSRDGYADRTVIVVLHARDVRHAVILAVPSVEPIHVEQPEAGPHVRDHDESIVIPNIDA